METFTTIKDLVDHPEYHQQRQESIKGLDLSNIDKPLAELVSEFTKIPYCFTLQCCFGHFLYPGQEDPHAIIALPITPKLDQVEYRIAYLALCINKSREGKRLLDDLAKITEINPGYIQCGCADWFWERQVNSYVLQVEPEDQKFSDRAWVNHEEALLLEKTGRLFFEAINNVLEIHIREIST